MRQYPIDIALFCDEYSDEWSFANSEYATMKPKPHTHMKQKYTFLFMHAEPKTTISHSIDDLDDSYYLA